MLYSNQLYSLENEDEYTLYAFAAIRDLSNKWMNMDLYLIIYIYHGYLDLGVRFVHIVMWSILA